MISASTIRDFQNFLDRLDTINTNVLSSHPGGHMAIGQSMNDQFSSPSDPAFYLHHGLVDNIWAQWQLQDPENRTHALSGTVTTLNNPPSQDATLDFVTQFGYLDTPKKLGDIMDTQGGSYCYRYEYQQSATKPPQ